MHPIQKNNGRFEITLALLFSVQMTLHMFFLFFWKVSFFAPEFPSLVWHPTEYVGGADAEGAPPPGQDFSSRATGLFPRWRNPRARFWPSLVFAAASALDFLCSTTLREATSIYKGWPWPRALLVGDARGIRE